MMKKIVSVSAILLWPFAAFADSGKALPDYHLTDKCQAQSKAISGKASSGVSTDCEQSEQAAYDSLKKYWPKLDEAQKVKCLAATSGQKIGNYKILQQCLNREELRVDGKLQGDPKGGQH